MVCILMRTMTESLKKMSDALNVKPKNYLNKQKEKMVEIRIVQIYRNAVKN